MNVTKCNYGYANKQLCDYLSYVPCSHHFETAEYFVFYFIIASYVSMILRCSVVTCMYGDEFIIVYLMGYIHTSMYDKKFCQTIFMYLCKQSVVSFSVTPSFCCISTQLVICIVILFQGKKSACHYHYSPSGVYITMSRYTQFTTCQEANSL